MPPAAKTPGLTPAAAELLRHGRELIADLADAVEAIPPTGEEAAVRLAGQFSRLSEDCAEAAARSLALPAPPVDRPGHSFAAVAAVLTAAETEHDFGAWLAEILCRVAAHLGSAGHLVMGRSGSWEAQHVTALVTGTAGQLPGDLDRFRDGAVMTAASPGAQPAGPG